MKNYSIWFNFPAVNFIDGTPENHGKVNQDGRLGDKSDQFTALPVGNGRIGGLVFGGITEDLIKLNEETLWSGEPEDKNDPTWVEHLPEIRKLIFEGKYEEADRLAHKMQGAWNESYMPLGNLRIKFHHGEQTTNYKRELSLNNATVNISYEIEGTVYVREYFCSHRNNVMAIRLTCSRPDQLSLDVSVDSLLRYGMTALEKDSIALTGKAPTHVEPNYQGEIPNAIVYDSGTNGKGMRFEVHVKAIVSGGSYNADNNGLHISAANTVILFITAATSFNGPDKSPSLEGKDCGRLCQETMGAAIQKGYDLLRQEHITYYRSLFNRAEFSLGDEEKGDLPTDSRLNAFKKGEKDSGLYELLFQYGRYLLISSSLDCLLPANLQGIWNEEVRPPWSDNWTANINVEMNYWPAEPCNLPECHEPLIRLIDGLRENGRKTAKAYYGSEGWLAGGNIDIWNSTNPVGVGNGTPTWANWLMASPWLCQHLWLHNIYNPDRAYLENTAYPIMKESAEFLLGILVENKEGYLVTNPASSPERTFDTEDGQTASLSTGTTMDMSLARELFGNVVEAAGILGKDVDFARRLKAAAGKLLPFRIGRLGQLQEWATDWDDPNLIDSHCAFLYGLHPGWQITPDDTPELAKAAAVSLEFRGMCLQGWGLGWRTCLWARLKNSQKSLLALDLLIGKLVAPNMLGKIYPQGVFQIDANFGGTAGITEMLLQSQRGVVDLLPALPLQWKEGYFKGLRATGSFEVSIKWQDHALSEAFIASFSGEKCIVKNDAFTCHTIIHLRDIDSSIPVEYTLKGYEITFNTVQGHRYQIKVISGRQEDTQI